MAYNNNLYEWLVAENVSRRIIYYVGYNII